MKPWYWTDEPGFVCAVVLCAMLFISACGGSGGSPGPQGSSSPGAVSPVAVASSFDGRQYQNAGKYCVLGSGSPKWTCTLTTRPSTCNGVTQPSLLKIHTGAVDSWGNGFETSVYNSGQFTLASSGFSWHMSWVLNNTQEQWISAVVQYGTAVDFGGGCVVLFDDVGSI